MKTLKSNINESTDTNESTEKSPSKLLNSLKFLAPVVLAAILSTWAQAQSVLNKCIENGNDINNNWVASLFEEKICQRFFEEERLDEEGQRLDEEGQRLDEEGQKLDEEYQIAKEENQRVKEEYRIIKEEIANLELQILGKK